ncbi:KPN_02809 family neutral zinc metallopeptidase [Eleftheria terrae]|uniref:KPN_02809 family neutral zinc metallopeptidase n=1 Tax=Eleftheria terrae TaxID=1597781 RepID=UPI00263B171A|nr:neutral zinc metallopeptidase [Eleftheria terrae]WKB51813.1 zinc metallopeptidase [Eleftheria terrae]
MKWEGQRESSNVEDRRGDAGGGGGFGFGGRSIGIGSIVIALVGGWVLGVNPLTLLNLLSGGSGGPVAQQPREPAGPPPADDRSARFVSTVLASTEDVWTELLQAQGGRYLPARLTLFRGATPTACGRGQAAMGPFYCPADQHVYIDLGFFDTLERRLGAPGDFAQAYVIAHEVGHHVQHLLGITEQVERARAGGSQARANAASVRLELQADCLAGLWAHHSQQAKGWLEQGDVEEALNAAAQIGDDTLQRRSQGTVVPESFTHGSSEQRAYWFKRGLQSGSLQQCDTFAQREP